MLVDKARGNPCANYGANVVRRHPPQDTVDADPLDDQWRHRAHQHRPNELVPLLVRHDSREVGLDAVLHLVDLAGQAPGGLCFGDALCTIASPDGIELLLCVVHDCLEDLLHVGLVELGRLSTIPWVVRHQLRVLFHGQGQRGEDLQRGAGDPALVGRGVLEDVDPRALEHGARAVGEEEVGAFDDHAELGAVSDEQALHVLGRDRVRPAAARHEEVGRREGGEVELVAELRARAPAGAVGQGDVGLVHGHQEAVLPQEGAGELLDRHATFGKSDKLLTVQASGII
mmetsp:Transcript_65772/g.192414  ORF Transcript_65772/g.192414 Transcript_65772/m.192414 type:complete len:286 (+) Transcript_65772:595-1452(+)